jgi:hypothetical protein
MSNSPSIALFRNHGRNPTECAPELGRDGGLRAHLDRLKGTQSNVGDQLSRSTAGQIDGSLVLLGIFRTDEVAVELFEVFVSTVFERSLGLCGSVSSMSVGSYN